MRSDSTYIAYRLVIEAMKRGSSDDMTAMVGVLKNQVSDRLCEETGS